MRQGSSTFNGADTDESSSNQHPWVAGKPQAGDGPRVEVRQDVRVFSSLSHRRRRDSLQRNSLRTILDMEPVLTRWQNSNLRCLKAVCDKLTNSDLINLSVPWGFPNQIGSAIQIR